MTVIAAQHPTTALDLDVMARIAEEAGRDAFREPDAVATFEANPVLRAMPTADDTLATAARLYRACLRGATDFATD